MQTPPAENLLDLLKLNTSLAKRFARGVTHEESLIVPPAGGNCFNWVVGHMLTGRNTCLDLLGLPGVLTTEEREVYDRGSAALGAEKALPLSDLISRLQSSLDQITQAVQGLPPGGLDKLVHFGREEQPLGGALAFLQWHETYHLGQLDPLRRVCGKEDSVV